MPGYTTIRERQDKHARLLRNLSGPLRDFLPDAWIESAGGVAKRVAAFPPLVMVWCMIRQALYPDASCRATLAWLQAARADAGLRALSHGTGGYCKARQRLSKELFPGLAKKVASALTAQADKNDLWCGRRVLVADGSAFSMPDTAKNQAAFPQPRSQKPGCGFPVAGFVSVLCLATGALINAFVTTCDVHDLAMFYFVRRSFVAGDIFLGDRGFASYAEMALFRSRGVDSVLRLHQRRKTDFRRGRVLGVCDHIVLWQKPPCRPKGLREEDWRRLPDTMPIREIRYQVTVKGYRTQTITLSTTLLDAESYPMGKLAELYFRRWEIEVDYRHVKITMQMDILRGQSPDVVEKEFWAHLLVYNLLRRLMWEAGTVKGVLALALSVKGAIQHILARWGLFWRGSLLNTLGDLLARIAREVVPDRPGRVEPRVRKRRPKNYSLMTKPRSELKKMLPKDHY